MRTSIGIFGGTFDPIHNGHLALVSTAMRQLKLPKIIFVPAGQPWLKSDRVITATNHRLEMTRLAIADNTKYELSTIETAQTGFSHSVDTIATLKQQLSTDIIFIMGWDCLIDIPRWKNPELLLRLCKLAANRPPQCFNSMPSFIQNVIWLDISINVRSTCIRNSVRQNLTISGLVPEKVEKYIMENNLYKTC